jgi:hypothetical protein
MMHLVKYASAVGAAAILFSPAIATAAPAAPTPHPAATSGRSLPKLQTDGFGTFRSNTWRVRPSYIDFGTLYYMTGIHWTSWKQSGAYGTGRLIACAGEAGPCVRATVKIHAWDVFDQPGPGPNFGYLRYTAKHSLDPIVGGSGRSRLLWINSRGNWWWRGV